MLDWHSVRGKKFGDLEKPLYSSWHDCYRENKVNGILSGIEKLVNENKFSNKKYNHKKLVGLFSPTSFLYMQSI